MKTVEMTVVLSVLVPDETDTAKLFLGNDVEDFRLCSGLEDGIVEGATVQNFTTIDVAPVV